eukprot:5489388-Alexandrium_andersonii.AAC.1
MYNGAARAALVTGGSQSSTSACAVGSNWGLADTLACVSNTCSGPNGAGVVDERSTTSISSTMASQRPACSCEPLTPT